MKIKNWFATLPSFLLFRPESTLVSEPSSLVPSSDDLLRSAAAENERLEEERLQEIVQCAKQTALGVRQVGGMIRQACRDSEPQFLRLGAELQEIYGAAMGLTSAVQGAALHLSQGVEGQTCLDRAGFLMEHARSSLNREQKGIGDNLTHIRELLQYLQRFITVCEGITRIGLWFRVVSVNIEIECNAQNLSGEMFAGVSKEVNVLSHKINEMVAGMRKNLDTAVRRLSDLSASSGTSLVEMGRMAEQAEEIVRGSYDNIHNLFVETGILIDSAMARSQVVEEKVGEMVVGIQFHDSMNQRIEHIVEAMQDIENLCELSWKDRSAGALESVGVILDFQHKQLLNLREEIGQLSGTTQNSLRVLKSEISDMHAELSSSRLAGGKSRARGADFFLPLQRGLRHLGTLLAKGNRMIEDFQRSAGEVGTVADQLLEMIAGVKRIREETHIKAINTIIMANHLGGQGMTIEVLAKEIRALADQTGEMANEVAGVQENIVAEVSALSHSLAEENATISPMELEQEVDELGASFNRVQGEIGGVAENTGALASRIGGTVEHVSFVNALGVKLEEAIAQVEMILEPLEPWRGSGQVQDESVRRLLERYTMDQERLVHASGANTGSGTMAASDDNVELF